MYETRETTVEVGPYGIRLLKVTNVDALFDQLIRKGTSHEDVQDERIPYWAELWPAAIGLGRFLCTQNIILPNTRVLEIGCGMGLPGIVAGLLGAEVTFSDYLPDALDIARSNWDLNLHRPAAFTLLDWRKPDPALAADVVLAADVAYEKRAFEYLPDAFRKLCLPGGRILLSEPGRNFADAFLDHLPEAGFRTEHHTTPVTWNGQLFNIRIAVLEPLP